MYRGITGFLFVLIISAGCSSTLCDDSWPADRDALIRGAICTDDNKTAIEDELDALQLTAVTGTIIVIDTDEGSISRVSSSVDGPETSRDAAVSLAQAEPIRAAATVGDGLEVLEGVGFLPFTRGDGGQEAVFVATSITVDPGVYVRVIGARPLVFVSPSIAIDGIIDLSAGCSDNPQNSVCGGPGGGDGGVLATLTAATGCGPGTAGTGGSGADTGAGGGGFGTAGGRGGDTSDNGLTRAGGLGGTVDACPDATLGALVGGSGGGHGEGDDAGSGGGGGGAIGLLASDEIRIGSADAEAASAGIWASGAGGQPGMGGSGGGGGGSGGAILLVAPEVTLENAVLAANFGGGGSAGFNDEVPEAGAIGGFSATAAVGGGAGEFAGGAGAAGAEAAQNGTDDDGLGEPIDGTGGGGGGAGRVRVTVKEGKLTSTAATVSPVASEGVIVLE